MTKIDLENLPYPMFVTTDEEKVYLTQALNYLSKEPSTYFLCSILRGMGTYELVGKISNSLGSYNNIFSYFEELPENSPAYGDYSFWVNLRIIWIKKLLAYSPETN